MLQCQLTCKKVQCDSKTFKLQNLIERYIQFLFFIDLMNIDVSKIRFKLGKLLVRYQLLIKIFVSAAASLQVYRRNHVNHRYINHSSCVNYESYRFNHRNNFYFYQQTKDANHAIAILISCLYDILFFRFLLFFFFFLFLFIRLTNIFFDI